MTASFQDYFSIQIFFIILRETLETAIIISVLLSFVNQRSFESDNYTNKSSPHNFETDLGVAAEREARLARFNASQALLRLQIWVGAILGLVICAVIGIVFILCFRLLGKDYWSYAERIWEGAFCLLSSLIITVMGIGLLRINKVMKIKWWIKLGDAYNESDHPQLDRPSIDSSSPLKSASEPITGSSVDALDVSPRGKTKLSKRYFLAILPLVTTLREGLEAVVFVGGIGMSLPPSSIPLSIFAGIFVGALMGYMLYRGGNQLLLQYFLICSTAFLYIVSAGLMSRGVWFMELETFVRRCGGADPSETGSGPGSYDIAYSVWHVNCCNGLKDGWWMVFNAIFGWTNSATYGSVALYIAYWLLVVSWLEARLYEERNGVLPFVPVKWQLNRIRKKIKFYEAKLNRIHPSKNSAAARDDDQLELRESEAAVLLT